MMNDVRAVLFDVDGTLLDTREYIFRAFEHSLGVHGFPIPARSGISRVIGSPILDCYRALTGSGEDDIERLAASHREFQFAHFELSVPFPNVSETLARLKERGLKLGAVTNRFSQSVIPTLSSAGLTHFFDTLVCLDQVERPKPDPMHLLKALASLDEQPPNAVMVGDSPIDIEAGKNAGTKTVFVTYGFHSYLPPELSADAIIGDIKELPALF